MEKGTHGVEGESHDALATCGLGVGVDLEVKSLTDNGSEEDEVHPCLGPKPCRQIREDRPRTCARSRRTTACRPRVRWASGPAVHQV